MATPTPSASKKPTGNVSTPSHLNQSSPAPRSVPSPVTQRHPAGKTPVNHPTTSSTGSKTMASTPMVQNLSQTGNTSSPSGANLLSFGSLGTPSGLGIEGVLTPSLNIATPALGGAHMAHSLSDLGLGSSGTPRRPRNEDEDRRARMRKILKTIGRPTGHVSEEGIARVSRRVGFANDIDAEKLTPEEKERKVGNRPISTAGNSVVIEIDLLRNVPRSVDVAYSVQSKALEESGKLAGKVLLENLRAPNGVALEAKLDRFGANLERLAQLDRLSASGVDCFEALGGVYASLRRLYEQEVSAAKAMLKAGTMNADQQAEMEVMCKKSGKPVLHARGKLGTEIEYWRAVQRVDTTPEGSSDDMEVDGQHTETRNVSADEDNDIYMLRLGVEPSPAGLYPSLRVSDAWLPETFELSTMDSATGIPWQTPAPTFLPADATSGDNMITDSGEQKLPDLRFMAKLDPPIVMPYNTAMNLLSSVDMQHPPMLAYPPQYAALLLDPLATSEPQASAASFSTSVMQDIVSRREDGEGIMVQHNYTLDSTKPAYADHGYKLEELPFSHPQQLVNVLPVLRQWACVGSMLKKMFVPSISAQHQQSNGEAKSNGTSNGHVTLDELLDTPPTNSDNGSIVINVSLATAPIPTLDITYPVPGEDSTRTVTVQILNNGDISFMTPETNQSDDMAATQEKQKLARGLEMCNGEISVWIEWLRARGAGTTPIN